MIAKSTYFGEFFRCVKKQLEKDFRIIVRITFIDIETIFLLRYDNKTLVPLKVSKRTKRGGSWRWSHRDERR